MELTIAIPTYQNAKQLVDCLCTLTRFCEYPFKIVVINNGPAKDADGVALEELIHAAVRFPRLKVIQAEENLGWQKAINLAFLEECDTPLFCMCNDDLVFTPDMLFMRKLCKYFEYPDVGAVGPSTNYVMGSQNLWGYGLPLVFSTTLLIGYLMVVRSEAFAQVGGLDDGLVGGDDLDLSILLRKEGYKLLVDRTAYVHHIGSQTGPRVPQPFQWNSHDHIEETNNALIRKHGVRAWYDCIQSIPSRFDPVAVWTDAEGDLIRQIIGTGEGKHGLDLGCGGNKTIPTAIGIDRDLAGAFGKYGGRKTSASEADIQGDVTALEFPDDSQDYAIARHVLEHIVDTMAALREWHRVLKPGGRLVLACPNHDCYDTMVIDASHVHAFTPESLSRFVLAAGFESARVEVLPPGQSFVVEAFKA